MWCGFSPDTTLPRSVTLPRRAGARPMIAFMVVDLPAPLRPSSAMVSPCRTDRPTPNRIWLVP